MQILRPHPSESQTSITHQNYLARLLEHRMLGPILIHGGWGVAHRNLHFCQAPG